MASAETLDHHTEAAAEGGDAGAHAAQGTVFEDRPLTGADGTRLAVLLGAAWAAFDETAAAAPALLRKGPRGGGRDTAAIAEHVTGAEAAFARKLGDPLTRLDRTEPELNVTVPGDLRDTTTPDATLADLQALLLGDALSPASRGQLIEWLCANTTGNQQLRAGVPAGWRVGDKTGSGSQHEANDIGILWPPQRKPLLVTAYYAGSVANTAGRHAVLAEVGRIAAYVATLPSGR